MLTYVYHTIYFLVKTLFEFSPALLQLERSHERQKKNKLLSWARNSTKWRPPKSNKGKDIPGKGVPFKKTKTKKSN